MVTGFSKYEGAGNDFIIVDVRNNGFQPEAALLARLCDRHFGIGADGVMLLAEDARYDCSMRYYNADGSEGEMCGNGARCFALFAMHRGICTRGKIKFRARDGVHTAWVRQLSGHCGEVVLGMTDVERIDANGAGWLLNTGVPHYVELVDDLDAVDVVGRGRALRRDTTRFPEGANIDFVEIAGGEVLRLRTYERGVEDETLACGTGAVAAALVAWLAREDKFTEVCVQVPGGELRVAFEPEPESGRFVNIRLTGPARRVFEGTFDTDNL